MNRDVDAFIEKSDRWKKEISALRRVVLTTKLDEAIKWNKPCYSHKENNIAIIQPFKGHLALMFFKGTLLKDAKKLLVDNGPHSQAARRLEFRSVQEITKSAPIIKAYLNEAIAIEESGEKVVFKKSLEPRPAELNTAFAKQPRLKKAFDALTPGRQRAYVLHFSSAKQSSTRQSRIEKCTPRILKGLGLNDR